MALNISDFNGSTIAPGGAYPYGQIKDTTPRTIIDTASNGDLQQFFQRIMANAGITPNSLPDNSTNGFQLVQAMNKLINQESSAMAAAFGASGFTPVLASGCAYSTGGGFYSVTAGWIWYNGQFIYMTPIVAGVPGAGVLLATISTADALPVATWRYASTVTDATHFPFSIIEPWADAVGITALQTSVTTLNTEVATLNTEIAVSAWANLPLATGWVAGSITPQYSVDGMGRVYLRGNAVVSTSPTSTICTLPAGARPTFLQTFVNRGYVVGANVAETMQIDPAGVISTNATALNLADVHNVDGITFLNF